MLESADDRDAFTEALGNPCRMDAGPFNGVFSDSYTEALGVNQTAPLLTVCQEDFTALQMAKGQALEVDTPQGWVSYFIRDFRFDNTGMVMLELGVK